MAIRNNALSMYQDQKKKNSLQPYLDAGNASTTLKTDATRVSPTYTQNTVAKAYSAPKTASTAVPLQSAVAKAYNQPAQQSVPAQTAQNVPKATASMTTPTQNTNTPTLQQAYGNTGSYSGSYGSARQNALNQAEASYNKLLNYLPEYMELLGMGGLGVSNQALLNAYGTYQQNVNDINAQYDELERAYRDQQITNASNVYENLNYYITNAGDNFTQDGYEKFKQGLLEAGYTEQEIAAGEKLLQQSDLAIVNKAINEAEALSNNSNIIGSGISQETTNDADFGSYFDTGKEGTKQYQLVQDILTAARSGKIENGTIVDFNYGNHANEKFFVYYNGYFYEVNPSSVDPKTDKIIGRGRNNNYSTYESPYMSKEDFSLLSPDEQYRIIQEEQRKKEQASKKVYVGYIDPNDL